jgi:hypothetical protein
MLRKEEPYERDALFAPYLSVRASRRWTLAAVFSSTLGVGLVFGFQPPLIALALRRAGSSSFAIGAVTAASLIAVILLGPFYPAVIARLGLKASIVAGVGCAVLVLLAMPAWPQVGAELPTANTVFVMVYCLGGVIGPSAGGLLMDAWPDHGLQALLSGAAFILLGGLAL